MPGVTLTWAPGDGSASSPGAQRSGEGAAGTNCSSHTRWQSSTLRTGRCLAEKPENPPSRDLAGQGNFAAEPSPFAYSLGYFNGDKVSSPEGWQLHGKVGPSVCGVTV